MRPVVKKNPGESVSFENSQGQIITSVIQEDYPNYGDAKWHLVGHLGQFCQFCEGKKDFTDIEIEHLNPKAAGGAVTRWENFLLACKSCNTVKPKAAINLEDYHWPHKNNTYLDFVYDDGGRVMVNPEIPACSQAKATALMRLYHLDRWPGHSDTPSEKDYRWRNRVEAWTLAERYRKSFESGCIAVEDIVTYVRDKGCWSIWFRVFAGIDEVRKALIEEIPGTAACCFDAGNHYDPVPRNPGVDDCI